MWRLIFLGIVVWLVVYIFKRNVAQSDIPKNTQEKTAGAESIESETKMANEVEIESMVQCVTCAVHLPRSEAFLVNGKIYCCKAHIQNK